MQLLAAVPHFLHIFWYTETLPQEAKFEHHHPLIGVTNDDFSEQFVSKPWTTNMEVPIGCRTLCIIAVSFTIASFIDLRYEKFLASFFMITSTVKIVSYFDTLIGYVDRKSTISTMLTMEQIAAMKAKRLATKRTTIKGLST